MTTDSKAFHGLISETIENNSISEEVQILTETETGNFSLYTVINKNGVTFQNVPGAKGYTDRGFLDYIQRDPSRPILVSGSAKVTTSVSSAASVSWPVASIIITIPPLVVMQDANVWKSAPTFNQNDQILDFRNKPTNQINRIFMKFDVTEWSSVTSAVLSMRSFEADKTTSTTIVRVTVPAWTESGVTWNTYDGSNAWATPGGDFTTTNQVVVDQLFSFPGRHTNTWNILDLVTDAIDNRSGILDIMLKYTVEDQSGGGDLRFVSSEHLTFTDEGPELILT